jgi:protein-disulfide isomerase
MARPSVTPNRILAVGVVAVVIAGGLVVASMVGARDSAPAAAVHGGEATAALLEGIPQQGNVLGNPDAPVTLVEYADFQCPYCALWARDTLPPLVRDYVRTGRVKLVFHGVAVVGPDSVPALEIAVAAGEQNRYWNVAELLFHNQGGENQGWVTDDLMRSVGGAVPGLDADEMMDARDSADVQQQLADAQGAAVTAGVRATPSFEVGPTGGEMAFIEGAQPLEDFRRAIDRLLQQ